MFYKLRNILNKEINFGDFFKVRSHHCSSNSCNFLQTIAYFRKSLKIFLNSSHFLTVALYFCIALGFIANSKLSPANYYGAYSETHQPTVTLIEATAEAATSSPPVFDDDEANYKHIAGILQAGDTLSTSFKRHHISDELRLQIIRGLEGHLDFKELRPNDHYAITIDDKGELIKCVYESGPLNIYAITRTPNGFHTEQLRIPLSCETVKIAGTIQSSHLCNITKIPS